MKKLYFKASLFVLLFSAFYFCGLSSNADTTLDYLNRIKQTSTSTFGYDEKDKLTIRDVSNSSIDVDSPLVKKGSKDVISYIFVASTKTGYGNPVEYWCYDDISKKIDGSKFSVSLGTDKLNKDTIYYLYAIPLESSVTGAFNGYCAADDVKSLLTISDVGSDSTVNSKDPCFKISENIFGEGDYCSTQRSSHSTSSSSSTNVYSLTNISHTYKGDKITLTWKSLSSVRVRIYYEDPNKQGSFILLGTVSNDDETYTFTADHDGDYLIRFEPVDGTQVMHYTAHYTQTSSPQVTPTVKPVVVGPRENILLVLIGTVVLYAVYRLAKKKA